MTDHTPALERLWPLARMMAAEQAKPQYEDATQECLIAAWLALDAGKEPRLVRADMRRAAINVDRGRSFTGNKRKPGINGVDTHQRYGVPLLVTLEDGEEGLVVEPVTDSAEDIYLAWEAVQERLAS